MDPVGSWSAYAASYNRLTNTGGIQNGSPGEILGANSCGQGVPSSTPQLLLQAHAGSTMPTASSFTPTGFLSPPPVAYEGVFTPIFHQKAHYGPFQHRSTLKQAAEPDYNQLVSVSSNFFEQPTGWSQNNHQLPSPFGILPHESVVSNASSKPYESVNPHPQLQNLNQHNSQLNSTVFTDPKKQSQLSTSSRTSAFFQQHVISDSGYKHTDYSPRFSYGHVQQPCAVQASCATKEYRVPQSSRISFVQNSGKNNYSSSLLKINSSLDRSKIYESSERSLDSESQSSPISYVMMDTQRGFQNTKARPEQYHGNNEQSCRFNTDTDYHRKANEHYSSSGDSDCVGVSRRSPIGHSASLVYPMYNSPMTTISSPSPGQHDICYNKQTNEVPPLDVSLPQSNVSYSSSVTRPEKQFGDDRFDREDITKQHWNERQKRYLTYCAPNIQRSYDDESNQICLQDLSSCRGDPMSLVKTLQQQTPDRYSEDRFKRSHTNQEKIQEPACTRVPPPAHHNHNNQNQSGYFDFDRWNIASGKVFSATPVTLCPPQTSSNFSSTLSGQHQSTTLVVPPHHASSLSYVPAFHLSPTQPNSQSSSSGDDIEESTSAQPPLPQPRPSSSPTPPSPDVTQDMPSVPPLPDVSQEVQRSEPPLSQITEDVPTCVPPPLDMSDVPSSVPPPPNMSDIPSALDMTDVPPSVPPPLDMTEVPPSVPPPSDVTGEGPPSVPSPPDLAEVVVPSVPSPPSLLPSPPQPPTHSSLSPPPPLSQPEILVPNIEEELSFFTEDNFNNKYKAANKKILLPKLAPNRNADFHTTYLNFIEGKSENSLIDSRPVRRTTWTSFKSVRSEKTNEIMVRKEKNAEDFPSDPQDDPRYYPLPKSTDKRSFDTSDSEEEQIDNTESINKKIGSDKKNSDIKTVSQSYEKETKNSKREKTNIITKDNSVKENEVTETTDSKHAMESIKSNESNEEANANEQISDVNNFRRKPPQRRAKSVTSSNVRLELEKEALEEYSDSDPSWNPDPAEFGKRKRKGKNHRGGRKKRELSGSSDEEYLPSKGGRKGAGKKKRSTTSCTSTDKAVVESPKPPTDYNGVRLVAQEKLLKPSLLNSSVNLSPITNDNNRIVNNNSHPVFPYVAGDFLIATCDQKFYFPPLWRVKDRNILHRFIPFVTNGVPHYHNISTFTAWSPNSKYVYHKIEVEFIQKFKKNITIRLITPNLHKVTSGENVFQNSLKLSRKYQEFFDIYIQALISQSLDSNFLQKIHDQKDDYFLSDIRVIDEHCEKLKSRLMKSLGWSENLLNVISKLPSYNTNISTETCVCGKKADVNVSFQGLPYDYKILKTLSYEINPMDVIRCNACFEYIQVLHKLCHHKQYVYAICDERVQLKKKEEYLVNTTIILNELLSDNDWLNKMFVDTCNLWAYVEKIIADLTRK